MKKLNFNIPFVDCFGKPIEGKNMAEQICMHLFNLSAIHGTSITPDRKYMAYKLCNRISSRPEEVELSVEECCLVKELANDVFSAGGYGQVVDTIENNI